MLWIKTLITALIVWIGVLAAYGLSWWGDPPDALAGMRRGGQAILALSLVGCAIGLVRLWMPARSAPRAR